ncbi:MAG TPA: AMP-binding protein [Acidimicrobiia bacterium]|nr:AMP-binding protein [Acidimicrobiia bacterium]
MFESYATVWEAIADVIPDAPVAMQGERRDTWGQLEDRAARLAGALAAQGVGPGTHVALYLFNCPEYAEVVFACLKLRAVPANVNFRYRASELVALLDNADAEVVVYHEALADRVAAALPHLPKVRMLIGIDDDTDDVVAVPRALGYRTVVATHDPAPRIARDGHDHLLWYTGGTTGLPKGVVWEQGTLLRYGLAYTAALTDRPTPTTVAEVADAARALVDEGRQLVTLLTTPQVHATAAYQLHATLSFGGALALLPRGRVDGDEICRVIEREHVTVLSVVGDTVLRRMVDALVDAEHHGTPYDISSLRRVHGSGALSQVASKDALHARTAMTFYDSLGASEGVGFGLSLTSAVGEAATARFQLGANARVLDEHDRDVVPGSGEAGVLAVATSIGIGYYNDAERSAATFRDVDGVRYAILGDWAVPHADGTITLLGRGSGCINTGGEKVWPEEVEEALKAHPAVVDAVVVGIPDEEWGEAIAAVVATDSDAPQPEPDELSRFVATQLASYKRPRRVVFVDEVQRTTIGKADYEWAGAQLSN